MSDLISKAAVENLLGNTPLEWELLTKIEALTTIDAVPIVRCKDCYWWDADAEDCTHIYPHHSGMSEDDFCSHSARRGNV